MDLWIATTNEHKLIEFKTLFEGLKINVHTPKELPVYFSPDETGKNFLENAQIKARSLHAIKSESWVMAEDSGICAEGLNGSPGIHSARYAGDQATDSENNQKLLHMLKIRSQGNRKAYYKAVIVLISPEKEEFHFEGEFKGSISEGLKGTSGFGYDPIFIPDGETKSVAELGVAYKNRMSHRSMATKRMLQFFKERGLV